MTEANKDLIKKIEAAWDSNQVDGIENYFSPNWKHNTGVPGMPPGIDTAKAAHGMSMSAMPDRKMTIEGIWSEGNKVAVLTRMNGTNTGGMPWFGAGPNGAKLDAQMLTIYEVEDGKVVESTGWVDYAAIMQQLGVAPPPAG